MFRKILALTILLLAPSLAHADWHEASSKHFIVYSDDKPERIKQFTERLERFDKALRVLFGTKDPDIALTSRVTVFMVENPAEIRKLAGDRNVGGFFQARASGSMAFVPRKDEGGSIYSLEPLVVLMHEYAHNFMYSNWTGVVFPAWFSEGFAEFVGTAMFKDDGAVVLGKAPLHRSYEITNTATMPSSKLVQLKMGKLTTEQRLRIYARGWLLTHYLMFDKERSGQLAAYLRALNSGKSADEATQVFGDVGALDGKMNAYIRRAELPALTVPAKELPIAPVVMRKLSDGEAATMPARILSSRGVNAKTAPEVANLARRLAAPYPDDAGAQNELAEAEFDAKNYVAAEAAADRALKADPKSIHALLYKGMAQMEIAKAAKDFDPARWKAIRALFLQANKLDVEYPQPLILFYESFEAAEMAATKNAQTGLLAAYQRAPYDSGLRMMAAKVLLQQGDKLSARIALETVAYAPHAGESNLALDMLTALDEKGAPAALEVLKTAQDKAKAAAAKKPA